MSFSFPRGRRLVQAEVLAILKGGKRLARASFELRFLQSSQKTPVISGKLAISVPKKFLKSAVARNRIKRLVREAFRLHPITVAPLQLLVIYKSKQEVRRSGEREPLRRELAGLLDNVIDRTQPTFERTA